MQCAWCKDGIMFNVQCALQFALWCACAEQGQTLLITGPCLSWLSCQRLLALSCFEAACYRNIDKPWIRKSHSRLLLKSYYHRIRCYSIPHTIRRYSPSHPIPNPISQWVAQQSSNNFNQYEVPTGHCPDLPLPTNLHNLSIFSTFYWINQIC